MHKLSAFCSVTGLVFSEAFLARERWMRNTNSYTKAKLIVSEKNPVISWTFFQLQCHPVPFRMVWLQTDLMVTNSLF